MERDFLLWRYLQIKVTWDIFNSCISVKNDSKFYNLHPISLNTFQGSQWINFKPVYSTFMFTITTGDMFQQKKYVHMMTSDFHQTQEYKIWPWPSNHLHNPFDAIFLTVLSSWLSFLVNIHSFSVKWPCAGKMCPNIYTTVIWGFPLYSLLLNFPDLWLSFTQHTSSNLQIPAVVSF